MNHIADVWRQLETVVDPELDESVTDMGFISNIDVDEKNCVHIGFRLPTYWCAANFAFMMADDMRTAVRALPWVQDTDIVLGEHMYADAINRGVKEGLSFQDTFGDEANGNLDDVRRTFLVKAFQRRQEALINHFLKAGNSAEAIVTSSIDSLSTLANDDEGAKLTARYLERRGVIEAFTGTSPAFIAADGKAIPASELTSYLAGLRRIRANAEFNGALCRGLLAVRFDMTTPLTKKCGTVVQPIAHNT